MLITNKRYIKRYINSPYFLITQIDGFILLIPLLCFYFVFVCFLFCVFVRLRCCLVIKGNIAFAIIWPYIHKAQYIVIQIQEENSLRGEKEKKNIQKQKSQKIKFQWPASCLRFSAPDGIQSYFTSTLWSVSLCQWCNLLMFVAFYTCTILKTFLFVCLKYFISLWTISLANSCHLMASLLPLLRFQAIYIFFNSQSFFWIINMSAALGHQS